MKILFISNLFPDQAEPGRGLVNARLLRHLAALAEIRVLALRPSLKGWWSSDAGRQALPPDQQFNPKYIWVPYLPKLRGAANDQLYTRQLRSRLKQLRNEFPFEAVLCSWMYPDAAAVASLAKEMDFRFVAVAQGSDVHQYLEMPARRSRIVETVNQSSSTIARSAELARLLVDAGANASKVQVVYNGVETDVFQPGERLSARQSVQLPLQAKVIVYVGNLLPVKNPELVLQSFARFIKASRETPEARLVMIGKGPLEDGLKAEASRLGVDSQVVWTGALEPSAVVRYLQAADAVCIPSDNEGLPNVLLEAMACGRPVIATNVGGIPEILNQRKLGLLVPPKNPEAMANAMKEILTAPVDEDFIAAEGRKHSWTATAQTYHDLLGAAKGTS